MEQSRWAPQNSAVIETPAPRPPPPTMDDHDAFAQTREPDNLFDDDFTPIAEPVPVSHPASPPTPRHAPPQQQHPQHGAAYGADRPPHYLQQGASHDADPNWPPAGQHGHQHRLRGGPTERGPYRGRGRGSGRGEHGPGRRGGPQQQQQPQQQAESQGQGRRGSQPAEKNTPTAPDAAPRTDVPPPAAATDAPPPHPTSLPSTTPADPQEPSSTPGPEGAAPIKPPPAVRGPRHATGGTVKPKLTEAELSARLEAARLTSAKREAAHAAATADEAQFRAREEAASQRRRAETQQRRVMDSEREKNRARKLKGQGVREWDEGKREEDFAATRGRGNRRGMHGGVTPRAGGDAGYGRARPPDVGDGIMGGEIEVGEDAFGKEPGGGPAPAATGSTDRSPDDAEGRGRGGRGQGGPRERGRGRGRGGRGGPLALGAEDFPALQKVAPPMIATRAGGELEGAADGKADGKTGPGEGKTATGNGTPAKVEGGEEAEKPGLRPMEVLSPMEAKGTWADQMDGT